MLVDRGGKFSLVLSNSDLAKGLRNNSNNPRNNKSLFQLAGAIGKNGVLTSLTTPTWIDTSGLPADGFPFPQFFVANKAVIVCSEDNIYEYDTTAKTLALKFSSESSGDSWRCLDFIDFVYLSNGTQTVIRNSSGTYGSYPLIYLPANAICNYNGQVFMSYGRPYDPLELPQ